MNAAVRRRWIACRAARAVFVMALFAVGQLSCGGSTEGDPNACTGSFCKTADLALAISPSTVAFGNVQMGSTVTETITLTHVGTSGVVLFTDVRLDTDSTELSITQPGLLELVAGQSTTFDVAYTPVDEELDDGVVYIHTNIPGPDGTAEVYEVPITSIAPYPDMRADPPFVDFGAVQGGVRQVVPVSLINSGFLAVDIVSIDIKPGASGDFGVETAPELPVTALQPDQSSEVELYYEPTGGDVDTAQLRVIYQHQGVDYELLVVLSGQEVSARLNLSPVPIDFGYRDPDVQHTIDFNVGNKGSLTLEVTDITIEEIGDWSSTVTVDFPAGGFTIEAGSPSAQVIPVHFLPPSEMPVLTAPIANLRIASNDPAGEGVTTIPVFGRPQAPSLQVQPPDVVDFGFVAQNFTATRKVLLFNAGSSDLTVTQAWVDQGQGANPGEFEVQSPEAWGPTASTPTSAIIAPSTHHEIKLDFTNTSGNQGDTAWGMLTITSDDGSTPVWEINLKAVRAGAPTCEVELIPEMVDFGIVPRGLTKTMKFDLVVTGSGECGFHSAFVNDCGSWMGMFGTSCDDPHNTIQMTGNSDYYTVTQKPFSAANNLKPGDVHKIAVTFTPPETAPLMGDENTDFAGLLAVRVTHTYTPTGQPETLVFPTNPAGGSWQPNLHAKSGIAELSVFPQELDFGLTTIGCYSQTLTIHAYNIGSAPLDLSDFQHCNSPEFKLKSYPALTEPDGAGGFKLTLMPDDGVEFEMVYQPQDEGPDDCFLEVYTGGDTPAAVVPIHGAGTFETEHTDEYIQTSGQDVDVLFVVDNSGSMSEEQSNLSTNFSNFISEASTWNNDYQVGVISTDVEGDGGLLKGSPRYVTSTNWNAFTSNVKLGTGGSGTEQGLMAMQLALSLPLIANSTIACTTDADCTAPEGCVDGFCGGYNRGFLRKDAALEIVIVSDEDDQSPADLNFYVNFLKNLKGFYNSNLLHVHAIVGPTGGCSSSAGDAIAGHRYMDVATQTGGNIISVCEPDFATGLQSIGEIAFGLKVQFFLSRVPDPTTIEVKVAGVECPPASGGTNNWAYDQGSNSVVFNEAGGCMPQPGETVWIHYDTVCFLE